MSRFLFSFRKQGIITPGQPETPPDPGLSIPSFLPKAVSAFTTDDIGMPISIPYTDAGGVISGPILFEVVGVNHHTSDAYPQTITLMTKNIIRRAAFDAKETGPKQSIENIDFIDRPGAGNNRWKCSNIRQWLNSDAANSWWTANYENNEYDAAPTSDNVDGTDGAYANAPGFLAGFSNEVIQHLTEITNTTALYTNEGTSETTVDKVFLPSITEMFGVTNDGIYEGTHLYLRFPTYEAGGNPSRIKQWNGKVDYYWLRSPDCKRCQMMRCVTDEGADNWAEAYAGGYGITPIIVIH